MKKILRLFLYSFYTILGFIFLLVVFLFSYYSILEKKQIKQEKEMAVKFEAYRIHADTRKIHEHSNLLNLIPVPQKVQFSEGVFEFPKILVFSVADSIKKEVADYLKLIPDINARYSKSVGDILFRFKKELSVQGYTLDIKPKKILITYSTKQGLYYARIYRINTR